MLTPCVYRKIDTACIARRGMEGHLTTIYSIMYTSYGILRLVRLVRLVMYNNPFFFVPRMVITKSPATK